MLQPPKKPFCSFGSLHVYSRPTIKHTHKKKKGTSSSNSTLFRCRTTTFSIDIYLILFSQNDNKKRSFAITTRGFFNGAISLFWTTQFSRPGRTDPWPENVSTDTRKSNRNRTFCARTQGVWKSFFRTRKTRTLTALFMIRINNTPRAWIMIDTSNWSFFFPLTNKRRDRHRQTDRHYVRMYTLPELQNIVRLQ